MMTAEEFFPTHLILRPDRDRFADHLKKIRRKYGRKKAKLVLKQAYWVGCVPSSPGKMKNLYGIVSSN